MSFNKHFNFVYIFIQVVPDSLILPLRWLFTNLTTRFLEQGCDIIIIIF